MKTKNQVWLHFVGKSYYSINQFIKEAEQIGVNRAIAPKVLRKMTLGDLVLLAQKDGASTKIFGCFVFSQITGLTSEAISILYSSGAIRKTASLVPMHIERGCGHYDIVASYAVTDNDAAMETIYNLTDEQIGRVMVGGTFYPLINLEIPEDYVLCDIPFQMGFRLFDFDEFRKQYRDWASVTPSGRHIKVKGQFYANEDFTKEYVSYIEDASLLEIANYKLN